MTTKDDKKAQNILNKADKKFLTELEKELEAGNRSNLLLALYPDYWEVPVSWKEFITNRRYLGNSWYDEKGNFTMYPFWWKWTTERKDDKNTVVFSGSTGCYDGDTEYFNGRTWKKIKDYKHNEKVLQYDATTKEAQLVKPFRYITVKDQNLTEIRTTKGINQVITDDHEFIYERNGKIYRYKFNEIKDRIKNKTLDGSILSAFQYEGEGLMWSPEEVWASIQVMLDSRKGEMPFDERWYKVNRLQQSIVMDEVRRRFARGQAAYSTSDRRRADFVQFVFASNGFKATISRSGARGGKNNQYKVVVCRNDKTRFYGSNAIQKEYKGTAYCFEVPSGMLVLRRNGKIAIGANCGKEQPWYSKVQTPSGEKNIGDIKVGDKVLGIDGKPQDVVGVYPQGVKDVYRLWMNDGSYTDAGKNHLWTVSYNNSKWETITTEEIIKRGDNPRLPKYSAAQRGDVDFGCDPYIVGAFIGNGCCKEGALSLSSGNTDVPNKIAAMLGATAVKHAKNFTYNFVKNGVRIKTKEVLPGFLIGKGSFEKHVSDYKYGSENQRLELLRGLMDTDGSVWHSPNNGYGEQHVNFQTTSEQLAKDVAYVVRSLGYEARMKTVKRKPRGRDERQTWNVRININGDMNPFSIPRKADKWRPSKKAYVRKIAKIEKLEKQEECFCIKVSNENELYLTDEFIVTHNTVVASALFCYELYKMMCLKHPRSYYGLSGKKKIYFAVLNPLGLQVSRENSWGVVQSMIQNSPWFKPKGRIGGDVNPTWLPKGEIGLKFGSLARHITGLDLWAVIFDEVSEMTGNIKLQQKKALTLVTTAKERMSSRFPGEPTRAYLASSKKTEMSFLEDYIEKQKKNENENIDIVDKPRYEILPKEKFNWNRKIYVGLGEKHLANILIGYDKEDNKQSAELKQSIADAKALGYRILEVPWDSTEPGKPSEFLEAFQNDIDLAMTNIVGISVTNLVRYISGEFFYSCMNKDLPKFFPKEVYEIGTKDEHSYIEFFMPTWNRLTQDEKKAILRKKWYMHIDTSKVKDKTGISLVTIDRIELGNENKTKITKYRSLFTVYIKAPKNAIISMPKNRQFIYDLKELGFKLNDIGFDSWQSLESQTILEADGYKARNNSVDVVNKDKIQPQYLVFKNIVHEGRLISPWIERLGLEVIGLERDANTGKIDHSPSTQIDAKDGSDSLAGACYLASLHQEEHLQEYGYADVQRIVRANKTKTKPSIADERPDDRFDIETKRKMIAQKIADTMTDVIPKKDRTPPPKSNNPNARQKRIFIR